MNQVVFWLILLIILVAIEIATMGLTTIWFAGGAFVAIIAAALNTPLYVQITLFLIVSVVLLLFTRPIAMKYFNKDRIKTNAESLIGKQAVVTEDIDNLLAVGLVSINGQEWTARNVVDGMKIPKGCLLYTSVIILLMYCGRLGSLTFTLVFARSKPEPPVKQPVEKIVVG